MLKLDGKNLEVQVPMTFLKSIGDKHLVPSINDFAKSFIEKMHSRVDFSPSEDGFVEEILPYVSNYLFLTPILETMVVNNITLSQALEASEDEMKEAAEKMSGMMFLLRITGVTELIEQLLDEVVEKIVEAQKNGEIPDTESSLTSDKATISVKLSNLPQALLYTLDNYGLYKVAEQASQNPELRNLIHNKTINPVIESVLKVSEEEDQLLSSLNPDEKKELQDLVTECQEDSVILYPLQTIISTVLNKAIDDNITFSQAAETFDPETLMKEIMEKAHNAPDLSKYQSVLEDITKLIS